VNDTRSDVAEWLEHFLGKSVPTEGDTDLFDRFGIAGDDASEFMEAFATRFDVPCEDFLCRCPRKWLRKCGTWSFTIHVGPRSI
jgi:hypothetical protein